MSFRTYPLPTPATITGLLSPLLGRSIVVRDADHDPVEEPSAWASASYRDPGGELAAAIFYDVAAAAFCGAALSLLPPRLATESVKAGILHEELAANLHEIVRVAASLFRGDGSPLLTLADFVSPPDGPPLEVQDFCRTHPRRLDLLLRVEDYGDGRLSLFVS